MGSDELMWLELVTCKSGNINVGNTPSYLMSLLFGRHGGFDPLNILWQLYRIIVIHFVNVYVDGIVYADCKRIK